MSMPPPPPPLPPGTVVPQKRLAPPPMPAGRVAMPGLGGQPGTTTGMMPAAPPMPFGMGYANASPGYAGGALPPPPPPLPPGTVVPQTRLAPPPMPAVMAQLGGGGGGGGVMPPALPGVGGVGVGVAALPQAPARKVLERPANGQNVQFPNKVAYLEAAEDLEGEKEKGILRLKNGHMAVVYKTDDPHWWLGKVGDEVGWIASHTLQEIDPLAPGRQQQKNPEDASNPRSWDSKKEGQMSATEMDMDKTDFSMTNATTFDHGGAKITAFFIQVSGVRKNVKKQGDIWVVAKTLKAFNRLRVAWEEDYGIASIPVEPPPARWADCSESDWSLVKGAALRKFLDEVKQWPNLRHSQDLKHFLTTDRVNLSGGMISKKTMKPYLDAWVKTSAEPTWTQKLAPIPSKENAGGAGGKPSHKADKAKKAAIPGLRAGDELFGQLSSRRPKLRRSGVFNQISALAAVTKQESMLENGRRGWTHAGLKLQLLTQGGEACSLKRRSERNIFHKYFAEDEEDDYLPGGHKAGGGIGGGGGGWGGTAGSRVLMRRGGYNQMKSQMRYNLEKIMYGRMENLGKEDWTKYAVYAKQKEQEKLQKDGVGANKRGSISNAGAAGQHKKNSMFRLEVLAERLENITRVNELQSKQESALDRCQYLSTLQGRFTMPLAAQLMALDELGREDLDLFLAHIGEGSRPKLERMKEVDSFLEDKRVRCHQLVTLLDRMHTPDERLLVVLTCCARLTDAVEAEEQGLFKDLECSIDALNLKRARLAVQVLVAEAQAEEASRASRKAAREVHADVQRARKALGFLSKAVEKIRSGVIKSEMFEELKERLEAAADAAHEEYCDAVKDAKPANECAEQAASLMESAEKYFEDLDELGTGVKDRVKVLHNGDGGMGDLEPADTEESLLVAALEVLLTIACNAHELATRAADNARFDMQTALEEVAKAEKIIRRVELEERRARNECDAAEENEEDGLDGCCLFGEWADDAKEHAVENLDEFRKGAKYRLHLDKSIAIRGSEDMLMMATLLSKVQLLRDLKSLQMEAKAEEQKRQDSLMQSNSKRRRRSTAKRESTATAPERRAPLRQQSSLGPAKMSKSTRRAAPMRQQSDLFPPEIGGDGKDKGKRKAGRSKPMGEIEDQLDEDEDEDEVSSDEAGGGSAGSGAGGSSDEEGTTSSSEVDSVFGSDLDADDDDLAPLRKSAGLRGSAARRARGTSLASRAGGGGGGFGVDGASAVGGGRADAPGRGGSADGTTRRHDRMRKQLIQQSLGKRRSIGTKCLARGLAPLTPRLDATGRRQGSSGHFDFRDEAINEESR